MTPTVAVDRPAVLGGTSAFPEGLPLVRPTLPDHGPVLRSFGEILDSGILTNGPTVRSFEEQAAAYLGITHVVAVSSCTAGLMLVLQAMGVRGRPVVLPSFTFSATAHAVHWAGGRPVFAEVDDRTATVDVVDVAGHLEGAGAVMGTHVYGTPCDVDALGELSAAAGVPVLYDAAHALGSRHGGRLIGRFGGAEVFSLSPTKVTIAGEGGLVATEDAGLAEVLRQGRDYGHPGDYDCRFPGLNARMSEFHAALGAASLAGLDDRVARRRALVARFREAVAEVPGVLHPETAPGDTSTHKDLTIRVRAHDFGLTRDQVAHALAAEGVDTRRYFAPPVHRQQAYAATMPRRRLPVTDRLASEVLTLPLWSHMDDATVDRMASVVARLQQHHGWIRRATGS